MTPIQEARAYEHTDSIISAGRRFFAVAWEHISIRFELLALEAVEERTRLVNAFVAGLGLVMFAGLTLSFIGFAIVVAAWSTPYRTLTAALVALAFAIIAVGSLFWLRQLMSRKTPLFQHSLGELHRDVNELRQPS